jgi:hypothetical protein
MLRSFLVSPHTVAQDLITIQTLANLTSKCWEFDEINVLGQMWSWQDRDSNPQPSDPKAKTFTTGSPLLYITDWIFFFLIRMKWRLKIKMNNLKFAVGDQITWKAKKKNMCVYCHLLKKNRVGRSGLLFFF